MKKLNDLLVKRSNLINEMQGILDKAKTEKRERSESESGEWTAKRDQVNGLNAEIQILTEQDNLNRSIADQKLDKEEKKAVRKYDLSRAISGVRSGNLEGLEREMHQEAEKEIASLGAKRGNLFIPEMIIRALTRANEETKTTGSAAGHIPLQVGEGSVIAAQPLYRRLGATVYEGISAGKIDLPFSKGHTAASVAEEGSASQSNPTTAKGTLTATRFQGWQKYTDEYLAESSLMPAMLADMLAALDRGIGKSLIADAAAVNVLAGYATTDVAAAMTWKKILAQLAALETAEFVSEGFAISKQLFFELAQLDKGTDTGQFIVQQLQKGAEGIIAGIPAFGTSFLPLHDTSKYDSIYGDWKESYVGMWGGAQLLIDPFTGSDSGYTKITFMRLAAVDSNPYAFASIRNASIT